MQLRPTDDELQLILKFQQQLMLALENSSYFDVLDSLDIEENGGRIPKSSTSVGQLLVMQSLICDQN